MAKLGSAFFEGDTVDVAKRLLGCTLVRVSRGKRVAGRIVEVEAYRGEDDPASHAYGGITRRNIVMFGEPGRAYVYFTMGMHWCLNVTTERLGTAGAVLIRALEPKEGVSLMLRRRGRLSVEDLANGPAKLTQAMDIDGRMNGEDLATSARLFIESGERVNDVGRSSRVGIRSGTEREWRFFAKGSRFVSRGRPSKAQRIHN
jgi:DNA-3-methyladenine glycosylase